MSTDNYIFEECHKINDLLGVPNEVQARQELIRLLDYHSENKISYDEVVNHLIRQTGLYPYIDVSTSRWEDRYVYDLFKVDVGLEEDVTLHREQSFLLKLLLDGEDIAVSAPTSFGKSFVVDAFIKIAQPANVMIIVPTLALTDETRRRLYKKFSREYKIITTSEVELGPKNIFIFPQERALNYLSELESIDILIIDEFYKASSKFDKTRSPSLVKAMIKLGHISKQRYYLAPNISQLQDSPFTEGMRFEKLNFNTVFLEKFDLYQEIGKDQEKKTAELLKILQLERKTLIYAGTYTNIDKVAQIVLESHKEQANELLTNFADWLSKNYSFNWILPKIILRGTGIHNGRLHRSLSQIQVKLFEEPEGLTNIISTSSIVEGVNTSAENVIIWMNRNGASKLNDFMYKNIIGRGGRMFKYFVGKIYILDSHPDEAETQLSIEFPDEIIGDLDEVKHKGVLTKDQVAAIVLYQDEMSTLLGEKVFKELKEQSLFESSDSELIRRIAIDMSANPNSWKVLGFLNSYKNSDKWTSALFKILRLKPGYWDIQHTKFVEFIKIMKENWYKPIPELLLELDKYDIGIDDFFRLERNLTFKFSSLLNDVNTLQKRILKSNAIDISKFVYSCSYAFLPSIVFQLEEYGLPRMISKKIHDAKIIDLYEDGLTLELVIEKFNNIGFENLLELFETHPFEIYILRYFYDGIAEI